MSFATILIWVLKSKQLKLQKLKIKTIDAAETDSFESESADSKYSESAINIADSEQGDTDVLEKDKKIHWVVTWTQMIRRKKIGKLSDTGAGTWGFKILKFGSQNGIPKATESGGMQKMSMRRNKIIMYITLGTGYVCSVITLILDKDWIVMTQTEELQRAIGRGNLEIKQATNKEVFLKNAGQNHCFTALTNCNNAGFAQRFVCKTL